MSDDLQALARKIDRLERTVEAVTQTAATVTGRVDDHDTLVQELAEAILDLRGPRGIGPDVTSWLDLQGDDEDAAGARLHELAEWLGRVYRRYGDAKDLPSCWAWHPDVVEELWWLYCCHRVAYYARGGSWAKVSDWHTVQRPGVVKRVAAALRGCELDVHNGADTTPPQAPLAEYLGEVAATWAERREVPQPTPQALLDAHRHDHGSRASGAGQR